MEDGATGQLIMDLFQNFFRWIHVLAGVLWIGLLYFFNWVNGPFAATMDGETKKKVVPELLPRALYFFRFGALFTWVTGILLLGLIYYHGKFAFVDQNNTWNALAGILVLLTFVAPFIYDALAKNVKNQDMLAVVGLVVVALMAFASTALAGFSFNGAAIHIGTMFGTIMAFNVWFRIWPSQRLIITAVKNGQTPDAATVALAGQRSRHNTFMSIPLLWTMVNQHFALSYDVRYWWTIVVVVALGWMIAKHIYKHAGKVKGF